jgi:hypothetical protein
MMTKMMNRNSDGECNDVLVVLYSYIDQGPVYTVVAACQNIMCILHAFRCVRAQEGRSESSQGGM